MARDETAGTWRTSLPAIAGCFIQECPYLSSGVSCSSSDMRGPDGATGWLAQLAGSLSARSRSWPGSGRSVRWCGRGVPARPPAPGLLPRSRRPQRRLQLRAAAYELSAAATGTCCCWRGGWLLFGPAGDCAFRMAGRRRPDHRRDPPAAHRRSIPVPLDPNTGQPGVWPTRSSRQSRGTRSTSAAGLGAAGHTAAGVGTSADRVRRRVHRG